MRCHYEVLGLQLDATVDDIKKAYRKCALQWHPDKHADNKEEANKRFLEIQEAYETLSNDQERAWYDTHREVIINGGVPGEPGSENYLFNIFPYFSPTCFKGYSDDEKGFYTIYREMFIKIAEEDRPYFEEKIDFPDFGKSDSDYEQIVGPFYSFWLSYCTPRSFVWVEKHDTREANDRYVRRLMEKENKKLRDKAKKERNEEIRKIVEHVRKRDKRVEQYKKILEEKALLAQKKVKDKKEAERLKRIEQLKNSDYDWSAIDRHLEELELEEKRKMKQKSKKFTNEEEEEGEEEEDVDKSNENLDKEMEDLDEEDESDFDDNLYCVACDKSFKSTKSFKNHENSKKHKENVELLKKHMKEEDESLFKDEDKDTEVREDQVSEEDEEMFQTKTKLSKKQKKKRNKQNRFEAELNELSEDEDKDKDKVKEDSGVKDEEIEKNESEIVEEKPIKKEKKVKNDKKQKEVKEKLVIDEENIKQEEETAKAATICSVCMQEFETRNKLFDHIKQEGHAAPKQIDPNQPLSHNALKKLKRMAKAKK